MKHQYKDAVHRPTQKTLKKLETDRTSPKALQIPRPPRAILFLKQPTFQIFFPSNPKLRRDGPAKKGFI